MRAKLGDVIKPAKVIRRGTSQCPVLSMTMHDGIMLQSDRFKKSLASVDQSDYKVVNYGQLVVGFPIDEGVLYIQRVVPRGIMSPAYNVWDVNYNIIDPLYLELSLHSPQAMQYYKENLRGTTARRRSIPTDTLLALPLPLPSLDEQRQIAAVLDKVSDLMAKRHRQLNKLDELIKSRFMEMFGDPIDNTMGLRSMPLGEACYLKAGITTSADAIHDQSAEYSVPCYGGNGIRGYVEKATQSGCYPIVGRQGALCGNVQLVTGEFHATEHAVLVTPIIEANVVWLFHLLKLMDLYRFHTGAAQPGLAVKTLNTVTIPIADIHAQEQFAAFVAQTDKSKSTIQKSLEKLEILKKALLQKYFG